MTATLCALGSCCIREADSASKCIARDGKHEAHAKSLGAPIFWRNQSRPTKGRRRGHAAETHGDFRRHIWAQGTNGASSGSSQKPGPDEAKLLSQGERGKSEGTVRLTNGAVPVGNISPAAINKQLIWLEENTDGPLKERPDKSSGTVKLASSKVPGGETPPIATSKELPLWMQEDVKYTNGRSGGYNNRSNGTASLADSSLPPVGFAAAAANEIALWNEEENVRRFQRSEWEREKASLAEEAEGLRERIQDVQEKLCRIHLGGQLINPPPVSEPPPPPLPDTPPPPPVTPNTPPSPKTRSAADTKPPQRMYAAREEGNAPGVSIHSGSNEVGAAWERRRRVEGVTNQILDAIAKKFRSQ